ncbi:glycoside hydrolase [bacterium]|nr:glycoside hydrolase [bacterium]
MKYRIIILSCCLTLPVIAGEALQEIDMRGTWRFLTDDNLNFSKKNWDDSTWDTIRVPGKWEDQGYRDHDGYAWYRYRVKIPKSLKDQGIVLRLGKIDDVDRVYINGHFLQGRGGFPPNYISAFNWDRQYLIPADLIEFDQENVIAVRVYDEWGDGGITSGPIGIYSQKIIGLDIDLSGAWRFMPGDNPEYAEFDYNDRSWETIRVPETWESQSHPDLDGFAWYRKTVTVPESMKKDKVILVLGRIDDFDEVYFNSIRIARHRSMPNRIETIHSDAWQQERFYYVPLHIIRWNADNVIAVRVYDSINTGGIYEGPVGLTNQKFLIQYRSQ